MNDIRHLVRWSMLLLSLLIILFVAIQPAGAQDDTKFTGTVVSSSRSTVTVRTSDGQYQFFHFRAGGAEAANNPDWITSGDHFNCS
jgi:hypothetical protein